MSPRPPLVVRIDDSTVVGALVCLAMGALALALGTAELGYENLTR